MASVSGNPEPVYRGGPEQAAREMDGLLGKGLDRLSRAKTLGPSSSLDFAKNCLDKVGLILKKYEGNLSQSESKNIRAKQAKLEAQIQEAGRVDPKESVNKLWEKVFTPSIFSSTKSRLAKRSIEELAILYHSAGEDVLMGYRERFKSAFLEKGRELSSNDRQLATETDPKALRKMFLKEGVHNDLLDYHFAALEIDERSKKDEHLKAIATITLKAKMVGIELIDPRIKKSTEVTEKLVFQAEEMLKGSQTPLYLKSSLLKGLHSLIGPVDVERLTENYGVNIEDRETLNRFLAELGYRKSSKTSPEQFLSQIAQKELRTPSPEGMEKARLALLMAAETDGKPPTNAWIKTAKNYITRYVSDARQMAQFGLMDEALECRQKAVELFEIGKKRGKTISGESLKRLDQSFPKLREKIQPEQSVRSASERPSMDEPAEASSIAPETTITTAQAPITNPVFNRNFLRSTGIQLPPSPGAIPTLRSTPLPPPPLDLEFVAPVPGLPVGSKLPPLEELSRPVSPASTNSSNSAASIVGPPIYDIEPVKSEATRRQTATERREFNALKGKRELTDPSRRMGDLLKLGRYATESEYRLLAGAFNERKKAANDFVTQSATLSHTQFKKAANGQPAAFTDALEMALYAAENGRRVGDSQRLAYLYQRAHLAGIPLDTPTLARIENLKFTTADGKASLLLKAMDLNENVFFKQDVKRLGSLSQPIPDWGSADVRALRKDLIQSAYGSIEEVEVRVNQIYDQNQQDTLKALFHTHAEAAKDLTHPFAEGNLNMLADLLVFMARTGGIFSPDIRDIKTLYGEPKIINPLVEKLMESLHRLPEEENGSAAVSILSLLDHSL